MPGTRMIMHARLSDVFGQSASWFRSASQRAFQAIDNNNIMICGSILTLTPHSGMQKGFSVKTSIQYAGRRLHSGHSLLLECPLMGSQRRDGRKWGSGGFDNRNIYWMQLTGKMASHSWWHQMLMALKLSLVLLVLVLSYVATWDLLLLDYLNSVDLNIHYSISADTQNFNIERQYRCSYMP